MPSFNLKKHTSRNPLVRTLNSRFVDSLTQLCLKGAPRSILDAGCGEGFIMKNILQKNSGIKITGLDESSQALDYAAKLNPGSELVRGSVYKMPFKDSSYDLVIMSEVLEHLEQPQQALEEVRRVTKSLCVFSVPNEPFFRMGNIARLAYLKRMGNTPGHINHWTKSQLISLLSENFKIIEIKMPIPWIVVLCEKK